MKQQLLQLGVMMYHLQNHTIALEGNAFNWFTSLPPKSIYSWENLKIKTIENFKGFKKLGNPIDDLWNCKQLEKETLQSYFKKFVSIKP